MATLSPSDTLPSSLACQAVEKMSERKSTLSSGRDASLGTLSRLTSAAKIQMLKGHSNESRSQIVPHTDWTQQLGMRPLRHNAPLMTRTYSA